MKKCKICDGLLSDTGSMQCALIHQKYQNNMKRKKKLQKEKIWNDDKCSICNNYAKYYTSEHSTITFYEIQNEGVDIDLNTFYPNDTHTNYCEEHAKSEGLL